MADPGFWGDSARLWGSLSPGCSHQPPHLPLPAMETTQSTQNTNSSFLAPCRAALPRKERGGERTHLPPAQEFGERRGPALPQWGPHLAGHPLVYQAAFCTTQEGGTPALPPPGFRVPHGAAGGTRIPHPLAPAPLLPGAESCQALGVLGCSSPLHVPPHE